MNDRNETAAGQSLPMTRRVAKTRGTFLLPGEVLDELRDASYWARQSLARIAERALRAELLRMRAEFNQGAKFTRRPAA